MSVTEFFLFHIFLYLDWIRRFTVNLHIQSKYGKIRDRKNSILEHFSRSVIYAYLFLLIFTYLHTYIPVFIFSLFYYTNLIKLIKYGKYRNYDEISRLKSVFVLKNFVIFTGKQLCRSPFLKKLQACRFIEERLQHWCFPLHFRKYLRTPILKNISKRMLLIIHLLQQFICFRLSL